MESATTEYSPRGPVELQAVDSGHVRAVTHLEVARADIDRALAAFNEDLG